MLFTISPVHKNRAFKSAAKFSQFIDDISLIRGGGGSHLKENKKGFPKPERGVYYRSTHEFHCQ